MLHMFFLRKLRPPRLFLFIRFSGLISFDNETELTADLIFICPFNHLGDGSSDEFLVLFVNSLVTAMVRLPKTSCIAVNVSFNLCGAS